MKQTYKDPGWWTSAAWLHAKAAMRDEWEQTRSWLGVSNLAPSTTTSVRAREAANEAGAPNRIQAAAKRGWHAARRGR